MVCGLMDELVGWDGKSANDLNRIFDMFHTDDAFDEAIFTWPEDETLQIALSAFIKRRVDNGSRFSVEVSESILPSLLKGVSWQTLLHIFQALSGFSFSLRRQRQWERIIRDGLQADNKFLRAWSYYAFAIVAKHFSEYREECIAIIEMALKDESASVVARIRQMKKSGIIDFAEPQ